MPLFDAAAPNAAIRPPPHRLADPRAFTGFFFEVGEGVLPFCRLVIDASRDWAASTHAEAEDLCGTSGDVSSGPPVSPARNSGERMPGRQARVRAEQCRGWVAGEVVMDTWFPCEALRSSGAEED